MTTREALRRLHRIDINLSKMEHSLDLIELTREGENMAVDPKIAALITKFDEATDRIAARIQRLIDAGGLSAESQSALQAEVDKLNLLGQDPENPVPPTAAA